MVTLRATAKTVRWQLASAALMLVAACGGGGGSALVADTSIATPAGPGAASPSKMSSLGGSIVKGPVAGAKVCAYVLVSIGKGELLGCTTSNADGSYALNLDFEGEIVVEATEGTYTDEASGLTGVPLGSPLHSVTTLGRGANTLHATPLTALAFNRAVAAGAISQSAFQDKANAVRDVFGLPPDVDLARTLPVVGASAANPYGKALYGLSKMLGMGATLAGVIANADLAALKASFKSVEQCVPPAEIQNPPGPGTPVGQGLIQMIPQDLPGGGLTVAVDHPSANWRSLLPATGEVMGCQVTANSASAVALACLSAALQFDVTALAGSYAQNILAPSLPLTGLLLMGETIRLQGAMNFGGNLTLRSDQVEMGNATISIAGNLTLDSPNVNQAVGPVVATPVVTGLCSQMVGLTPAGIPKPLVLAGGGSVSLQGNLAAGGLTLLGGVITPQNNTLTLSPGATP